MSELAVGSLKGLAANGFVIDIAAGSTLNVPPPAILQVVSVVKTDAQAGSLAAGASVDITSFSPTITPLSATSKLLHFMDVGGATEVSTLFRITGGVNIPVGDAAGSRRREVIGKNPGPGFNMGGNSILSFTDTTGGTDTLTYGVKMQNTFTDTRPFAINRGGTDTDNALSSRTTSTWTIMEVAG